MKAPKRFSDTSQSILGMLVGPLINLEWAANRLGLYKLADWFGYKGEVFLDIRYRTQYRKAYR